MALTIGVVSKVSSRGKTTLVERLTDRFTSEGFSVATVKHIIGSFDTAKKDTWRHLEAGAEVTVAATSNELVSISRSEKPPLEKALKRIHSEPDLIFVEGYKNSEYPKILCAETAKEAKKTLKNFPNIIMVTGKISGIPQEHEQIQKEYPDIPVYDFEGIVSKLKKMLVNSILKRLPGLNCKHCGYDSCLEMAKAITAGEATMKDCQVLATDITALSVDGKKVPLGEFPQQIIRNIVTGILKTLKDVKENPHTVEITVKTK